MTSIAQSAIFGFGPQPAAGVQAHEAAISRMFRHRALDVDLSGIDDVRVGPPEIGGLATPTFPYKAGFMASGSAVLQPRLSGVFGWLLVAAVGAVSTAANATEQTVLNETALTIGAQTDVVPDANPDQPRRLLVRGVRTAALRLTGNVTITGTDANDDALEETVALSDTDAVWTVGLFKTVTAIDLPAYVNDGTDAVRVGYGLYTHTITFNQGDGLSTCLPWLTGYKFLPAGECTSGSDYELYEVFPDMKSLGMTLVLPNDAPITARMDYLGKSWAYSPTHPDQWYNAFEDYESVPVGCATDGYIKIPDYSANDLPVVQATVAMVNTPLDLRMEKVYGNPALEDITIVNRALGLNFVVKWKDPALYRMVRTNSLTGTAWSEKPFVHDIDVMTVSSSEVDGVSRASLRVQAPDVLLQVAGGIRLASGGALMMNITGQALAPSTGQYVTYTLVNQYASYAWPSS